MVSESETLETLEAAALQLTPAERERLVERLIATLDADPEVERGNLKLKMEPFHFPASETLGN